MNKLRIFWQRVKYYADILKKHQEETDKKAKKGTLRRSRHTERELEKEMEEFIKKDSKDKSGKPWIGKAVG